ncbi:MAG: hypothetical protein AAF657_24670 [Acidobacteriota bacterium]
MLHSEAERILPWCDLGVERSADQSLRESRGMARAATGDLAGALRDFEHLKGRADDGYGAELDRWSALLREGINPFTPELIRSLAGE